MPIDSNSHLGAGAGTAESYIPVNIDTETAPHLLVMFRRVLDSTGPFSKDRRFLAQTCSSLWNSDRDRFYKLSEEEDSWLNIEQYYSRLLQLELGGTQGEVDTTGLSIDTVYNLYIKIKKRQVFEVGHFLHGPGQRRCPAEHNDALGVAADALDAEDDLLALEQTHELLNSINADIIQQEIGKPPSKRDFLNINSLSLTRFPDSVITDNLAYFQGLKWLECSSNKLTALPDAIEALQSLYWLKCSDNQLTQLPDTIGALKRLKLFYCSFNRLTALPEALVALSRPPHIHCTNNYLVPDAKTRTCLILGHQRVRPTIPLRGAAGKAEADDTALVGAGTGASEENASSRSREVLRRLRASNLTKDDAIAPDSEGSPFPYEHECTDAGAIISKTSELTEKAVSPVCQRIHAEI